MRVLYLGIFNDHPLNGDTLFLKGLLQNQCEVTPINYRPLIRDLGHQRFFHYLRAEVVGHDLVFIGKGLYLSKDMLAMIRRQGIPVMLWYGDIRPRPEPWLLELLPEVDAFFMSSRGAVLQHYFTQGKPSLASYYFNPVDADLAVENPPLDRKHAVSFTARFSRIASAERKSVISALKQRGDVSFFGSADRSLAYNVGIRLLKRVMPVSLPEVSGDAYIEVIRRTGIGVGVNALPNVPGYCSDRVSNYLNFGTCFLTAWFPQLEQLFVPNEELLCFRNISEMNQLLNTYTSCPEQRDQIGLAGQRRALQDYSTQKIVKMMLDTLKHRALQAEWSECLLT